MCFGGAHLPHHLSSGFLPLPNHPHPTPIPNHPRYFDPETVGLDFKGMTADLEAAPDGSIVLLHGE